MRFRTVESQFWTVRILTFGLISSDIIRALSVSVASGREYIVRKIAGKSSTRHGAFGRPRFPFRQFERACASVYR
jgi:hypothetical protein